MLLHLLALGLVLIPQSSSRLLCGVELFTSLVMEVHIKLDCRKLLGKHRRCCTNHGVCYVFRKPWKVCDKRYCDCVHKIEKEGGKCKNHAENFCKIVKDTGRNVYHLHQR